MGSSINPSYTFNVSSNTAASNVMYDNSTIMYTPYGGYIGLSNAPYPGEVRRFGEKWYVWNGLAWNEVNQKAQGTWPAPEAKKPKKETPETWLRARVEEICLLGKLA